MGLVRKSYAPARIAEIAVFHAGVAGDDDDRGVRTRADDARAELETVHVGHAQVVR